MIWGLFCCFWDLGVGIFVNPVYVLLLVWGKKAKHSGHLINVVHVSRPFPIWVKKTRVVKVHLFTNL